MSGRTLLGAIESETGLTLQISPKLPPELAAGLQAGQGNTPHKLVTRHGRLRLGGKGKPSTATPDDGKGQASKDSVVMEEIYGVLIADGLFIVGTGSSDAPVSVQDVIDLHKCVLVLNPLQSDGFIELGWKLMHAHGSLHLSAANLGDSTAWALDLQRVLLDFAHTRAIPEEDIGVPLQYQLIRGTLLSASRAGNVSGITALLTPAVASLDPLLGFSLTSIDEEGNSPIHLAAASGKVSSACVMREVSVSRVH